MVQHIRARAFGVIILILEFGLLWPYGFQAKNLYSPGLTAILQSGTIAFLYFATLILAVLGYGLLLMYYRSSSFTAIFQNLFIVSFTTILLPPWMQFWYNTFIGGFDGQQSIQGNQLSLFNYYHDHTQTKFQISYFFLRITLFCSIAQLIALHAFFGRIGLLATAIFSTIFQLGWVFVFYLCISISRNSPHLFIYDDYLAANVYVFGSVFGVILSLFVRKPSNHQQNQIGASRISTILALVGTFFVFLSFAGSTFFSPLRFFYSTVTPSFYGFNSGTMNVFFTMASSTVTSIMVTSFFSQRINMRVVIWSSIMGGILFASVGNTMDSITGPISIGFIAALISSLFFQIGYPRINRSRIVDSYGGLGTFAINSILASFFIAPIVLIAMSNASANYYSIGNRVLDQRDQAGWVLIYFALSLAFGIVSAVAAGLFIKCFASSDSGTDFEESLVFNSDYGLYEDEEQKRVQKIDSKDKIQSADNINQQKNF